MLPSLIVLRERIEEDRAAPEDEVRVDALVKCQYHTKCHDCGRFLKKELWVAKDHKWKAHGLCKECFGLYDPPEY